MSYETIIYELHGGFAQITLNQPAKFNAISPQMGSELVDALERATTDARCVLIGGAGKAFCAGANLDGIDDQIADPMRDAGAILETLYNPLILKMLRLDIPIIASVPGVAAGFGMSLALASDYVLCARSAYFFSAFSKIGLVPDGGASWLLTRSLGRARAIRIMMMGEKVSAQDALDWGLVSEVVEDEALSARAVTLAEELATGPGCLGQIKQLSLAAVQDSAEDAMALERALQLQAGRTEDFVEGVKAFSERRKPSFKGI